VKRAAIIAMFAGLALAAPAAAVLPVHKAGSSVGEGVPFKAYASITPAVHLFGDVLTAKLALVADTKWIDARRIRVHTTFNPYEKLQRPKILRLQSGRFQQITYTWKIRCLKSPCVPRLPPSERYHVFHFSPARIDYLEIGSEKPRYGIDAYWPPVEVNSQVTPGVAAFLAKTNHIKWRLALNPMASPTYRVSPPLLQWLAIALAGLFGLTAIFLAYRWYLVMRPRRVVVPVAPGTPLERALAVLRYAHETGDETLQRKAFERVADELGYERADELTRVARELAWSPRTPEDEEVEQFAAQALGVEAEDER
jgi:hypothetical protein